ncbi:MAG TPA: hypothetical protein PK677_06295 [Acidiphilium sp.]|nr:MAG: hypothetical protein B7Z67_10975 [Acidiphilium sp. 21-60-14]OYV90686.1 MAG: hypothetical protein B7Z57_08550 [Acidiphilium sp. 37-60-79]OZB38589.1 MAG: hypothetical protein B7X48_12640 [Acidiphilium sp. 34-60-192]HQT88149.1 hypothetical protein [Acidiphilium sp.]HQU24231.1 hypothetical protein [Acidiphilium sp.]
MEDHLDDPIDHEAVMKAGVIVDRLIESMVKQDLPQIAIASALLGGALNVLSANLPDEAVLRILQSAMDSVANGELREIDQPRQ